ncbi:MAG: LysM peptidoglycan-binding domain-containing protein [Bradyrhizobium sp.]
MAQAEANRMAAALPASPRSPDTDESVPVFDVARIDRTGDAVIAGRAAPGATVELLLKGEVHDQAVADRSGQFVMIPPRLPPGDYELTLRSHQPDGKQATSKQSVVVALDEPESGSGGLQSHAETSFGTPETVGTIRPRMDQAAGSSQAQQSPHPLQIAKRQDIDVSRTPPATTAGPRPEEGSSSATVESGNATRVVSRGDSLWRISRVTYGVGTQYAVVYRANRHRIRNPDRIYPGQIIVLPMKAR